MTTSRRRSREMIDISLPSSRSKLVPARKLIFAAKLKSLLREYDRCLIISINNIGSTQISEMRKEFSNSAHFLFGKNSLIRKVIRDFVKETKNKKYMNLMDLIKGNVGLCFIKNDIDIYKLRKDLIKNKKQCSAKINSISPSNVFIPIGRTNCEPTKTSIFQNIDISTRINGGQIDVICKKHLIKKGSKINASQIEILSLLNIKPFKYGICVKSIYENGNIIKDCSFMDWTTDDIAKSFYKGIQQIAALCTSLSYPTIINVPHCILNAYKNTLALSLMLDQYSFHQLDDVKNTLKKPNIIINNNNNDDDDDTDNDTSSFNNPFPDTDTSSDEESSSSQD